MNIFSKPGLYGDFNRYLTEVANLPYFLLSLPSS